MSMPFTVPSLKFTYFLYLQAFYILAGSFVSEGATLFLAVNSVRKRAKALDMSFKDYSMDIDR